MTVSGGSSRRTPLPNKGGRDRIAAWNWAVTAAAEAVDPAVLAALRSPGGVILDSPDHNKVAKATKDAEAPILQGFLPNRWASSLPFRAT